MRLTSYDLRRAIVDPDYRRPLQRRPFPTTTSPLRAAVAAYHREGAEAAQKQLNVGLSGYFAQPGAPSVKARMAQVNLDTYINLATQDTREAFDTGVGVDLDFGAHQLFVTLDVLLFDASGYAGRLLLWGDDANSMTLENLELLATTGILAMRQELGEDRIVGVDVWKIRSRSNASVPNARAEVYSGELQNIVTRLALTSAPS